MKKTITLVLALIVVFALTSAASAISGPRKPSVSNPAVAPYTDINLQVVESLGTTGLGLLSLQPVPDNRIYEKGNLVYFALYFKTPDEDLITMDDYDYAAPYVLLSSNVVEFNNRNSIKLTTIDGENVTTEGTPTFYESDANGNDIYSRLYARLRKPTTAGPRTYILTGSAVVVGDANGVIQADFQGARGCTKFLPLPTTPDEVAASVQHALDEMRAHKLYSGKSLLYTVKTSGTAVAGGEITYTVTIKSGAYNGMSIQFITDYSDTIKAGSTRNVKEVKITDGTSTWLVEDQASSLKFIIGGIQETNPTILARLTGTYRQVMRFFELDNITNGILLPQHFGYKFSTFWTFVSDNVNRYIVPNVEIPQTGDAALSMVFAMIALAIAAACGAAYLKFRA